MPPTVTSDSGASLNSSETVANYDQPAIPFVLPPHSAGMLADTLTRAEFTTTGGALGSDTLIRAEFGAARRADTGASGEFRVSPTLALTVSPTAPTIPSTTALGATVATLAGAFSDGSAFTGSFMFVSPNYDADTYSISGSNLIVAANGPGVGSAGGSVEHCTIEAVQLDLTADAVTSSAPAGLPLKNSAGVWSWGPAQAGRQTGTAGATTWGPSHKSANIALSSGNLTGTMTVNNIESSAYATNGKTAGKYYWEVTPRGSGFPVQGGLIGIGNTSSPTESYYLGAGTDTVGWGSGGGLYDGAGASTTIASWSATTDTLCFALDMDNKKLWGRVNGGNWNNAAIGSQNPATNTGGYTLKSQVYASPVVPGASVYTNTPITDTFTAAFLSASWAFAAPSGFISTGGSGFAGGNVLYLNGQQVFSGDLIEVHHGGQFYARNTGNWFVWNGTTFVASAAP